MPHNRLVLSFPVKNIKKITEKFHNNQEIPWLYLGKNFSKRHHFQNKLGYPFTYTSIAKILDKTANSIRNDHILWLDKLNNRYGKETEWWFGVIASKDIYVSNLFQYSCYLEILDRIWDKNRPKLILLESPALLKVILKWAKKKNIKTEVIYSSQFKDQIVKKYILPFMRWGKFVFISILRFLAAYITKHIYKQKKLKKKTPTIINTFISNNSISKKGLFYDNYFPYLHEYLLKKDHFIAVYPYLAGFNYNYFSIYKRIRKSKTQFILQEDFLTFPDYLSAFLYPLRVIFKNIESPAFRNFDFSDLVEEEQKEQSVTFGLQAVLVYRFFLAIGKADFKTDLIITWYENQAIDKALIIASRLAFPSVKIIGAQMFIHTPNLLSLYPSQSEVEAKVTPNLLLTTSKQQCRTAGKFTSAISCKPAAPLRYSHLFNNENIHDSGCELKKKSILLLLSFDINESQELLETVKEGLNRINKDIPIWIKIHPDYSLEKLIKLFGKNRWPRRFEFAQGNLAEALKLSSLVISSNTSSMLEAAIKGIPIIFIARETVLNQNILSGLQSDIITECFNYKEMLLAIHKYLVHLNSDKILEYKKTGKELRGKFFIPVNDKTMSPFLGLD